MPTMTSAQLHTLRLLREAGYTLTRHYGDGVMRLDSPEFGVWLRTCGTASRPFTRETNAEMSRLYTLGVMCS